mgnify:CR=1 FL=1
MTERSSPRRQAIIRAALDCFSQHGVEATTIDMIRAASGASTGSLYHHFGSKERIAAEVYLDGLRQFRRQQSAYLDQAQTLEGGIRAIVHAHVDWIVENPAWADFIFHHRMVLTEVAAEPVLQAELQTSFTQVAEWMQTHTASGLRLRWPLDAYAALVTGPVHDYARHWLAGRRQTPLAELREFFAEAAIRAVGAAG